MTVEHMIGVLLIALGAASRLVPHPANMAPIGAIALYGGSQLPKKYALAIPLLAMILSDFFIGFDGIASRFTVYGSFLLIGLIGLWLKKHLNVINLIAAMFVSSILFFLTTNAGVWAFSQMYPKTLGGLMLSYEMGLPFLRNTILGDLLYTTTIFGFHYLAIYTTKRLQLLFTTKIT